MVVKEVTVEGRRIIFNSDVPGYIKKYQNRIVAFCQAEETAKLFPIIIFSLDKSAPFSIEPDSNMNSTKQGFKNKLIKIWSWLMSTGFSTYGYVLPKELRSNKITIHLLPDNIKDRSIESAIAHELTHAWHDYVAGYIKKEREHRYDLARAIDKSLQAELNAGGYFDLRKKIHSFILKTQSEGVAEYNSFLLRKKIKYEQKSFRRHYYNAISYAQGTRAYFLKLEKSKPKSGLTKAVYESLRGLPYVVGLHMVHALIYFSYDLPLEKIAVMKPYTFVKKYEACMLERGYKPAVSLTSGAGYFDYKWAVELWWRLIKKN